MFLESLASFLPSMVVVFTLLCVLWIKRTEGSIKFPHGVFAIIIFLFSLWCWHNSAGIDYANNIISSIFVVLTASMNVFYTDYRKVEVNINRRKKQTKINHPDRRIGHTR